MKSAAMVSWKDKLMVYLYVKKSKIYSPVYKYWKKKKDKLKFLSYYLILQLL